MTNPTITIAPFNITAAKAGQPVVTKGGNKVSFLTYNARLPIEANIIGLVDCGHIDRIGIWNNQGVFFDIISGEKMPDADLVMKS